MAKKATKGIEAEYSTEEKLTALYELQRIDSQIDEITRAKGELPLEVQDLEDEVTGLQTRVNNISNDIDELNKNTKTKKEEIDESKSLITKYEAQQDNVRNNREYDSLTKEVEYQKLEIELCEKKIKEYQNDLKIKKKLIDDAKDIVEDRRIDLKAKKAELDSIDKETAKEVETLTKLSKQAEERIDERLLTAYKRIRSNVRNGLGVVTIKRDACGGCYNRIPPQRQYDIMTNKKIIVCEYCGRILVADETVSREE